MRPLRDKSSAVAESGSALHGAPSGSEPSAAERSAGEGSRLYLTYVVPDDSHGGISRKVWAGTPWIIDAFTDSQRDGSDSRYRAIGEWCREHFGDEAWPFTSPPRPGRWRSGNATVFGWTWFGFSTEAEMQEFEAAWPAPTDAARSASQRQVEGQVPGPNSNSSISTTPAAPRKTTAMESHNHSEGEG